MSGSGCFSQPVWDLGLLHGRASGRFLQSSQVLWDRDVQEMKGLALGDFDDDGDLDLVVGDYWAPGRVYFNDGFGGYQDSGQRLNFIRGWHIAVGDIDEDGDLDFVAGNRDMQPLRVFLNDGTGHFKESGQDLGVFDAYGVKLADVDGDLCKCRGPAGVPLRKRPRA